MNVRRVLFVSIALLGALIALLQFFANTYYLYWEFWWYDVMMHFLGGLFISGGYLWILMFEVPHTLRSRIPIFLSTLIVMCCVGVAWEVFEYLTDSFTTINYTLDTTLDLLMDITGALVAYLIVKRI